MIDLSKSSRDPIQRITDAISQHGDVESAMAQLDPEARQKLAELQALEQQIVKLKLTTKSPSPHQEQSSIDIDRLIQKASDSNISGLDREALLPGDSFGAYQIVRELGRGGMGTVYEAVQMHLGKRVAVKVISPHVISDPTAIARFRREMKAAGQVEHGNVVRAMDAGEIEGTLYLVTEFVSGIDLSKLVKQRGSLPPTEAIGIIFQAAAALQAAHASGIIHRDVKPSNLVLTDSGQVKLLDLGLAQVAAERGTDVTTTGAIFGTPDYMAPEQWNDSKTVDGQVDLYALGCTLYFLVTGHAPFTGERYPSTFAKMRAHIEEPVPDLQSALPPIEGIDDAFMELLRRLMAKKPEDRFANAGQLVEELSKRLGRQATLDYATSVPSSEQVKEQPLHEKAPRVRLIANESLPSKERRRHLVGWIGLSLSAVLVLMAIATWIDWTSMQNVSSSLLLEAVKSTSELTQASVDADRDAARWITSIGGNVFAMHDGKYIGPLTKEADIPTEGELKLRVADVIGCQKIALEGIGKLASLKHLDIVLANDSSMNDDCIAALCASQTFCESIRGIFLVRCRTSDRSIAALAKCKALETLDVLGTSLQDCTAFATFQSLHTLRISHCRLKNASQLSRLPKLDSLGIDAIYFQELLEFNPNFPRQFRELLLFQIKPDTDFAPLTGYQQLQSLVIEFNGFSNTKEDASIDFVDRFPSLQKLEIFVNGISQTTSLKSLSWSKPLTELRTIEFGRIALASAWIEQLREQAPKVEKVFLDNSDASRETLSIFATFQGLKQVSVQNGEITRESIQELADQIRENGNSDCEVIFNDERIFPSR